MIKALVVSEISIGICCAGCVLGSLECVEALTRETCLIGRLRASFVLKFGVLDWQVVAYNFASHKVELSINSVWANLVSSGGSGSGGVAWRDL